MCRLLYLLRTDRTGKVPYRYNLNIISGTLDAISCTAVTVSTVPTALLVPSIKDIFPARYVDEVQKMFLSQMQSHSLFR